MLEPELVLEKTVKVETELAEIGVVAVVVLEVELVLEKTVKVETELAEIEVVAVEGLEVVV